MLHFQNSVNLLAVFVSAVILWLLGAIWYSPALFAKPWMEILGIKKDDSKKSFLIAGMIASFICDVVLSYMLGYFMAWSASTTFGAGVFIGCLVWAGFIGATNLPQCLYEGKPFKFFAITSGYWLLGLAIVGGVLAVWR